MPTFKHRQTLAKLLKVAKIMSCSYHLPNNFFIKTRNIFLQCKEINFPRQIEHFSREIQNFCLFQLIFTKFSLIFAYLSALFRAVLLRLEHKLAFGGSGAGSLWDGYGGELAMQIIGNWFLGLANHLFSLWSIRF